MKVGEITQEHGEQAIAEQRFGYRRLFACRSLTCPVCGFVEHGISELVVGTVLDWARTVSAERVCCGFCGIPQDPSDRDLDTHYHLMFT